MAEKIMALVNEEDRDALEILASMASEQSLTPPNQQRGSTPRTKGGRGSGSAIKASAAGFYRPNSNADTDDKIIDPQKWVQCAKCEQWRKVPYTVTDETLGGVWECVNNVWDPAHNSCKVPQALQDEEIDEILAKQTRQEQLNFLSAPPTGLGDDETDYVGAKAVDFGGSENGRFAKLNAKKGFSPSEDFDGQNANGKTKGRTMTQDVRMGVKPNRVTNGRGTGRRGGSTAGRTRPPLQGNRGRGRNGRGINDAAEALLGMVGDADDVDMDAPDEGNGESQPPNLPVLPSAGPYRPGTAVWAKVEGHDWWPGKVVRRRAVPREVGPPPGGALYVRNHLPVVFFTANGIPSEKLLAESDVTRSGEAEEAEYAWLLSDCIKPFKRGDSVPTLGGSVSGDVSLQASIEAASLHVEETERQKEARAASGHTTDAHMSDSDGGWGPAVVVPEPVAVPRVRGGKTRGRGGKRGRGKGNRRGGRGSKRSRLEEEMEETDSENGGVEPAEATPAPASVPKIIVEAIYGWRWPPSEETKVAIKEKEYNTELEGEQKLQELQEKGEAAPAPACTPNTSSVQEKANESHTVSEAKNALGALGDQTVEVKQDDKDAADALASLVGTETAQPIDEGNKEPEYYVKYTGRAHIHDEWVSESTLMSIAKRKCINFKRKHPEPCYEIEDEWMIPERFVARRCAPSGPGWEVLVKWQNQSFEHCTWEMEGEGLLAKQENLYLHKQLHKRQQEALRKASPQAESEEKSALNKAKKNLQDLASQPDSIQNGAALFPHQLQAVNWLRKQYAKNSPSILADEAGLGKTASIVTSLESFRLEFKAHKPALIVVPQTSLAFWEGELEFWAHENCNTVSFAGTNAAKTLIHDNELWLQPGSLDDRTSYNNFQSAPPKVVKADIVIAPYEAVGGENSLLSSISWNVVVIDERKRVRSALAKAFTGLKDFECKHRIMMSQGELSTANPATLFQYVSFLKPEYEYTTDVVKNYEDLQEEQQVSKLLDILKPGVLRRLRADIDQTPSASNIEIQIPVSLTSDQAEFYKQVLSKFYDVLVDPNTHRLSSSRASQSRTICDELRKVVSHPFVIPDLVPENEAASDRLAASGKLPILVKLLEVLQKSEKCALLLSHSPAVLEIFEKHFAEHFGKECLACIDDTTPSKLRQESIQKFNKIDRKAFLFMQSMGCCGLGTNLPDVSLIIVHDSDWNPRADIQAINRCHRAGSSKSGVPIFRLVINGTIEEKLMQMSENAVEMEAVYAAGIGNSRSLGSSAPLMEEILRWGTQDLFQPRQDPEDVQKTVQSTLNGSSEGKVEDDTTMRDESHKSAKSLAYEDEALATLMEKAIEIGQNPVDKPEQSSHGSNFGPGLEQVSMRTWQDSKDVADQEDEDGDEEGEEDADDENGQEDASEPMLGATYWASLLGNYTNGTGGERLELHGKPARKRHRTEKAAAAFADSSEHNSDAEDGEEANMQTLDTRKSSFGPIGIQSAFGEELTRNRSGKAGRGRNGGRGARGSRKRRAEADDDDVSDIFETREKRRRKGPENGYSQEFEQLQDELSRYDDLMANLSDPASTEGKCLLSAFLRMEEIVNTAELDENCLELAKQAAKILMLQKDDSGPGGEFEDYTILALVGVGASLSNSSQSNSQGSLASLAQRYSQDLQSLKEIHDFIMASLERYRSFFKKVMQMRDGRSSNPQTNRARTSGEIPGPLGQPAGSDMDNFAGTLHQIVHSDLTEQAMQGPLDLTPFQLPFVTPDIERENPVLATEFDLVKDQLREFTQQIALKDRVHSMRVEFIQKEYQRFMEKVRNNAQTAIDMANSVFHNERAELTKQVDVLVQLMYTRHLMSMENFQGTSRPPDTEARRSEDVEGSMTNHTTFENNRQPGQIPGWQSSRSPINNAEQPSRPSDASEETGKTRQDINGVEPGQSHTNGHFNANSARKTFQATSNKTSPTQPQGNNGQEAGGKSPVNEGKTPVSNGGLASIAVQSVQQGNNTGSVRGLAHQRSLPLQRLTSEQIADVQQQISSTPTQQSPITTTNQPVMDQGWERSLFPFFDAGGNADLNNFNRMAMLQAFQKGQGQLNPQVNSVPGFNPVQKPMEDDRAGHQAPFYSGRAVPRVIAQSGLQERPGQNWDRRSASSHSTPSRSPSPQAKQSEANHTPQPPFLTGKPILQAQGRVLQDGLGHDTAQQNESPSEAPMHKRNLEYEQATLGPNNAQADVQGEKSSADPFGQRMPSPLASSGWANPSLASSQHIQIAQGNQIGNQMDKPHLIGREIQPSTNLQFAGWPIQIQNVSNLGTEGPPILSSQTITSGAGPMGIQHSRTFLGSETQGDNNRSNNQEENPRDQVQ